MKEGRGYQTALSSPLSPVLQVCSAFNDSQLSSKQVLSAVLSAYLNYSTQTIFTKQARKICFRESYRVS